MFNHVMIGANDIEKTKEFYNAVLGVLGAGAPMEHTNDTGQKRIFYMHNGSTFSISEPINGEPVDPSNGSTLGFVCDSPEQIQEFHDVAIANGCPNIEPLTSIIGNIFSLLFSSKSGKLFHNFSANESSSHANTSCG